MGGFGRRTPGGVRRWHPLVLVAALLLQHLPPHTGATKSASPAEIAETLDELEELTKKHLSRESLEAIASGVLKVIERQPRLQILGVTVVTGSGTIRQMAGNMLCSFAHQQSERVGMLVASVNSPCDSLVPPDLAGTKVVCVELGSTNKANHESNSVEYHSKTYMAGISNKIGIFMSSLMIAKKYGIEFQLASDADVAFVKDPAVFLEDEDLQPTRSNIVAYFMVEGKNHAQYGPTCADINSNSTGKGGIARDINSGYYFLRVGDEAVELLKDAMKTFDTIRPGARGDQGSISYTVEHRYGARPGASDKWRYLCNTKYPNGVMYLDTIERWGLTEQSMVVGHYNWMRNSQFKLYCMKATGHWFIDDTGANGPEGATPLRCAKVPHRVVYDAIKSPCMRAVRLSRNITEWIVPLELSRAARDMNAPPVAQVHVLSSHGGDALRATLQSLKDVDYEGKTVKIDIVIENCDGAQGVAEAFEWPHGPKSVACKGRELSLLERVNLLDADSSKVKNFVEVFVEDAVVVSPGWYLWVSRMQDKYSSHNKVFGFDLQRLETVASGDKVAPNTANFLARPPGTKMSAFAVNVPAVAHFKQWMATERVELKAPRFEFAERLDDKYNDAMNAGDIAAQLAGWMAMFCNSFNFFFLYHNAPSGTALACPTSRDAATCLHGWNQDYDLMTPPKKVSALDWKGLPTRI